MQITLDLPDHVVDNLEVICATGNGKTREELAAHLIEQGVWRICGENMGFATKPLDAKGIATSATQPVVGKTDIQP